MAYRPLTDFSKPGPIQFQGMWTQDPGTKDVFRIIEKVAAEDVTVLVRGETGAGKELVAAAVHNLSPRKDGPFRAINCAALPPTLLESELFGHTRGAFTGAVRDAPGHFQLAHRGTLFLDEVAELPLELQAKLLRVLETGRVLPVGARDAVTVDVRIVSATHRALRREVEAGRFRSDLMYRLRVIPVFLPPLRLRPGDPSLLLEHFVIEMNGKSRRQVQRIAPDVFDAFEHYDWPGNIRELRNVLAYAYVIGEGPVLEVGDLPLEVLGQDPAQLAEPGPPGLHGAHNPPLSDEERRIRDALIAADGRRSDAALALGMSRVTLWRKIKAMKVQGLGDLTR